MEMLTTISDSFSFFKDNIYVPAKSYYDIAKNWKDNLEALEAQITALKAERDAVQETVREAEGYMRVANDLVTKWLNDVNKRIKEEEDRLKNDTERANKKRQNVMTCHELSENAGNAKSEVDGLTNDASKGAEKLIEKEKKEPEDDRERAKKKLFVNWRPHFMTLHEISKTAEESLGKIKDLMDGASKYKEIRGVSKPPPPAAAQQVVPSNDGTISSRKNIVETVVEALKARDINKVGVYGMGGIGKTVLANEVRNRVLEVKLFDEVVMCPLPRKPSIREIQLMIIDELGVKVDEKKESAVATRLRTYLKNRNVLVVLDNLWKPLDLNEIGIPIWDQDRGCKILLTSRELNILSENGMSCQKNISIPPLSQKEAEDLFKGIAGYGFGDGNALDSAAREIVQDCAGLPVSIVAAAKGLKKRPLHVWQSVRRKMVGNTMKQEEHSSIEMSYKLLEGKELQSAFVLCSQMANKCSIRDFLKFAIGLDVFDEFLSVEEAQDEVRSYVFKLREASLLLDTGSGEEIVMHDVVRDVGQSIASRDYQAYTRSQEAELKRWPCKDLKRICLYCHIVNLPKKLKYPQLEFLVIDGKDHLKVSEDLNWGTKRLKVLALYRCSFSSLPSFRGLNSLATLCLDGSTLRDANIDTIGKLRDLEILSFVKSDIRSLPEKLGELSKLRILDLSDCSQLEVIPPNVISRLTSLEELYLGNSFSKWKKEGEGGSTASLAELKKLSEITNLEIHIPDEGMMPEKLFPDKLARYSVTIGSQWGWGRSYEGIRRLLKLKLDTSILKESYGVWGLVRRAEVLHLEELGGVENNLYELDREGFPELKHLNVSSNSKIKYIVNAKKSSFSSFPHLESLILRNLGSLEKICDGNLRAQSLCNLKDLKVEGCRALKNLLTVTAAQKLSNLESITVMECEILEEIVAEEGDYSNQGKQPYVNAFSNLRQLDLHDLPKLGNFYSEYKKQSEEIISANEQMIPATLFNGKIEFSKLEVLTLYSASNIGRLWPDNLDAIVYSINNLKTLTVEKCHELKYLFTSSMVNNLEQLQELSVRDCNGMEEIVVEEETSEGGERSGEMVLPKLSTLLLEKLLILKRFCTGLRIDCPLLKRLDIKSCEKLETFISKSRIAGQEHKGHAEDRVDTQSPKPSSDQQPMNPQSQKRSPFKFPLFKGRHTGAQPALKKLFTKNSKRHREGYVESDTEENLQPDIQSLFDEKVLFPRLAEMNLFYMNNKGIWHKEFTPNSFCDLKKLTVKYCVKLQSVFPSNTAERFKRLDNLEITDCESLVEIFEPRELTVEEANKEEQFQLRHISLRNLKILESIWKKDPMGAIILKNLQSIEAIDCPNLKNIFPFSVANRLEKLEELKITNCEGVEHVIEREESVKIPKEGDGEVSTEAGGKVAKEGNGKLANEENVEVVPVFWFPNLTSVTLSNLPKLRSFYPEQCKLDYHSLKVEELKDCGVEKFSKLEDLIGGRQLHTEIGEMPSSSGEKAMDGLKFGNKETHVSAGEFPASTLKTLKLEGYEIKLDAFPLKFLQKFLNLEKLVVTNSSFKVLFSYEGMLGEQGIGKLVRIRNLEISSVRGLLHIWEEDYRLDPLLQYLETLDIQECPQMRELLSLSASFKNLTSLEVNSCNELSFIMTSSTARSLVQLRRLNVQNCRQVKEIVADQGDETNDAIIFSRLEHLGLVGLPGISSFSMESCTFIFPSMKEVIVVGCPKMKFFSRGLLNTPALEGVRFQEDPEDKPRWMGDLNSTIQGSFKDSSAQDSHTTSNNKVTEMSDAESDDVPLVRKIKGKEDSTFPGMETEMVHQAPSGEIEMEEEVVGSHPTTNNA